MFFFFFSSRRRHTRFKCDWSSDVCSSDLILHVDAIIDVENVVRRLRENATKPESERRPNVEVVRDATLEIRTSIVFATVIIVLVFLPIFGLSGVEGRLLTPLAFAYIVSLSASLLVAIIVTPALASAFVPNARSIPRGHDGCVARPLNARFSRVLPHALDHPHVVTFVAAALLMIERVRQHPEIGRAHV